MDKTYAYNKTMAVIDSCITDNHFLAAARMVANYRNIYGDDNNYWNLFKHLYELYTPF